MAKKELTKIEVFERLKTAKEKKRLCIAQLEKSMKKAYKERTGKEAEEFFAL